MSPFQAWLLLVCLVSLVKAGSSRGLKFDRRAKFHGPRRCNHVSPELVSLHMKRNRHKNPGKDFDISKCLTKNPSTGGDENPGNATWSRQHRQDCAKAIWFGFEGHGTNFSERENQYFYGLGKRPLDEFLGPRASFTPKVRKEYRLLSNNERNAFHAALISMKTTVIDTVSQYDNFVLRHDSKMAPGAHFGPAFCPWHREFLYEFEAAVQQYCPQCALPYWDSKLEARLGDNWPYSILFSGDFMGNAVGEVTNGFAQGWKIAGQSICRQYSPTLRRDAVFDSSYLFPDNAEQSVRVNNFVDMCYPGADNFKMNLHGSVHMGVSGHMSYIQCSPNDPMFYLHHCCVDYYFEIFRRYASDAGTPLSYPSSSVTAHDGESTMTPFQNFKNKFGLLSDTYTTQYYTYEDSPGSIVCNSDNDCRSTYLWCYVEKTHRCISKVMEGGRIASTFPGRACYCKDPRKGSIKSGKCQCV